MTTLTWQPPPNMSWWGSLEVKYFYLFVCFLFFVCLFVGWLVLFLCLFVCLFVLWCFVLWCCFVLMFCFSLVCLLVCLWLCGFVCFGLCLLFWSCLCIVLLWVLPDVRTHGTFHFSIVTPVEAQVHSSVHWLLCFGAMKNLVARWLQVGGLKMPWIDRNAFPASCTIFSDIPILSRTRGNALQDSEQH